MQLRSCLTLHLYVHIRNKQQSAGAGVVIFIFFHQMHDRQLFLVNQVSALLFNKKPSTINRFHSDTRVRKLPGNVALMFYIQSSGENMDENQNEVILVQEIIANQWVTVQRCKNNEEAVKVLVELERLFPSVRDSPRYQLVWEDDL